MRIKRFGINCLVVIILSSILLGCYSYMKSVQASLWMQNAEQTLEITSQGAHTFDTYITIERDRVHSLANKMSEIESHEESNIQNNLNLLGGEASNYTVVDLDNGILYSNRLDERRVLSTEELEFYRTFSGKGIRENLRWTKYHGSLRMLFVCRWRPRVNAKGREGFYAFQRVLYILL